MEIWIKNGVGRTLALYDADSSIETMMTEIELNGYEVEDVEYAQRGEVRVAEIMVR